MIDRGGRTGREDQADHWSIVGMGHRLAFASSRRRQLLANAAIAASRVGS
jgi:hypothetical protein